MSNYQRLISYIYTYEGGVKGKNIGFAKLETRGSQCRIAVNVKKIFIGGNPLGVYLLSDQGEVQIGTLFARNGAGEFRAAVNSSNIEGTGRGIEEFYGLSVHDVESAWRAYTTIWEDAVSHAAEVELAEVTAENLVKKNADKTDAGQESSELPIAEEIEREIRLEEKQEEEIRMETHRRERWRREGTSVRESLLSAVEVTYAGASAQNMGTPESPQPEIVYPEPPQPEIVYPEPPQPEIVYPEPPQPEIVNPEPPQPEIVYPEPPQPEIVNPEPSQLDIARSAPSHPGSIQSFAKGALEYEEAPMPYIPVSGDEREAKRHQDMWGYLRKRCAKLRVFDYANGCEILTIKPQDIGLLPRENWVYGNNSFLLHGYYNFRHLILARLENPVGEPRYILGIPGSYYNNEKHMAAMFGFPDFVLSKNQDGPEGRFGYWYADIRIGE